MAAAEIGYFRGEGGVIWPMALPLPKVMAQKVTKGQLRRVNSDGTPYKDTDAEVAGGETPARPAQSAPKAEWVGYAVRAHGLGVDDAEAMTKQDLIERFSAPADPATG
jgi:hypothetical protein